MAINPDEQYTLKGSQVQDLAARIADTEQYVLPEDWQELFGTGIEDVNGVGL